MDEIDQLLSIVNVLPVTDVTREQHSSFVSKHIQSENPLKKLIAKVALAKLMGQEDESYHTHSLVGAITKLKDPKTLRRALDHLGIVLSEIPENQHTAFSHRWLSAYERAANGGIGKRAPEVKKIKETIETEEKMVELASSIENSDERRELFSLLMPLVEEIPREAILQLTKDLLSTPYAIREGYIRNWKKRVDECGSYPTKEIVLPAALLKELLEFVDRNEGVLKHLAENLNRADPICPLTAEELIAISKRVQGENQIDEIRTLVRAHGIDRLALIDRLSKLPKALRLPFALRWSKGPESAKETMLERESKGIQTWFESLTRS